MMAALLQAAHPEVLSLHLHSLENTEYSNYLLLSKVSLLLPLILAAVCARRQVTRVMVAAKDCTAGCGHGDPLVQRRSAQHGRLVPVLTQHGWPGHSKCCAELLRQAHDMHHVTPATSSCLRSS